MRSGALFLWSIVPIHFQTKMNKPWGRNVIVGGDTKIENLPGASSAVVWNDVKAISEYE